MTNSVTTDLLCTFQQRLLFYAERINNNFMIVSDAGQGKIFQLPLQTNVTNYVVHALRKLLQIFMLCRRYELLDANIRQNTTVKVFFRFFKFHHLFDSVTFSRISTALQKYCCLSKGMQSRIRHYDFFWEYIRRISASKVVYFVIVIREFNLHNKLLSSKWNFKPSIKV